MGFIRIFSKTVKWILITIATLISIIFVFVFYMLLEYVGVIDINTKNNTDYLVFWEWWWNKDSNGESIIDLAEVMPFEWDYFVRYSTSDNLEEIRRLNIETDIYEFSCHKIRMMFVRDSKVVFDEIWSWELHPDIYPKGAVYFKVKELIVKKENAKFKASKDKDGNLWLEKIE